MPTLIPELEGWIGSLAEGSRSGCSQVAIPASTSRSGGFLYVAGDLLCSHPLAFLTNDPTNRRLVQFHIPEYDFRHILGAK